MKNKIKSNCLAGCLGLWLTILFCASSSGVPINLVQNGSFEGGWQNGPVGWGWTYNIGLASGFPNAAEGNNWADVYGTLYQDIATTPGQVYHLRFALAGNFNISALTIANVLWGGSLIGSVSWNPAGHNINNMGWVWGDFDMMAQSASTRITFQDPFVGDGSGRILRIDAVSATVPDATSSVAMLGLSLFAVFAARRQFKPV